MVVVLLGAPGAGKGTQAPVLGAHLGVPVLASGDLLRAVSKSGSALGREVERLMKAGQLVPDDTIVQIFLDRLAEPDAAAGAILDGFPRTVGQAAALDRALAARGARVGAAIYIDVPLDDLVRRMADRRICQAASHVYNLRSNPPKVAGLCDLDGSPLVQRSDDDEVTVRARMAQQLPPLEAVVDHYRRNGVLATIDGRRPIADVTTDLIAAVSETSARPDTRPDAG
jgi:adenylate kinase